MADRSIEPRQGRDVDDRRPLAPARAPAGGPLRETTPRSVAALACRGFLVGAGLHAGVALVAGLNSGRLLDSPLLYLRKVVTVDTLRFASFIALSSSAYQTVLALLCRGQAMRPWHPVVAGLAAGLVSLVDRPSRRRTLSLFVVARALGALLIMLHRRGFLPTVPFSVDLCFAVLQSLVLLCLIRFPFLMPTSYYRMALRWTGYYTEHSHQAVFLLPSDKFVPCNPLLHAGSCHAQAAKDTLASLAFFLKVYLVLYSMPLVLFRSGTLLRSPGPALSSLLRRTTVSTLSFGLDIVLIKYLLCLLRHARPTPPPVAAAVPLLAGLLAALPVVMEQKSRKLEMIYYGLPQLFHVVWRLLCIKKPLGLHRMPAGSAILLALSLAVLLPAFEFHPDALSPLAARALSFLLRG